MGTVSEKVFIIGATPCAGGLACDKGCEAYDPAADRGCKGCGSVQIARFGNGTCCALCGRFLAWVA